MNAKSKLWVIHDKKIILMNSVFEKMQKNTFSDEYKHLQKVKQDNPDYTLSVRKINRKPNKKSYRGLTYEYMRSYIILHTEDGERSNLLHEFEEKLLISRCQARSIRYPKIKNWFLKTYPEVKDFASLEETADAS